MTRARGEMKVEFGSSMGLTPWLLAAFTCFGCDKLAAKENVAVPVRPPLSATPDTEAGVGGGFTPRSDASVEGLEDAAVATVDSGEPLLPGVRTCPGLPESRAFSKIALLESVAVCATHYACEFDVRAQTLLRASEEYADVQTDMRQAALEAAWYDANRAWEVLELLAFGPAAAAMEPGGQGLRDEIDAFPLVSRCSVEESLVSESYASPAFDTSATNGRGLGALEFAIFSLETINACSAFNSINSRGTWAALSAGQLRIRRAAYVAAAARIVAARATRLFDAWSPDGQNFTHALATAGAGSAVFPSAQSALNAVSNRLFFVDKEVKDFKVGRPGGLMDCTADCAALAEAPYARVGRDFIADNLFGFRLLFEGCGAGHAGLGFDDWLREVGRADLAEAMASALTAAEERLASIDRLEDAFVREPGKIQALHAEIKGLTDLLKMDFVSVLNLDRPMSSEGDND